MSRPVHFTDDALLQAAYDVFREQGMDATTAEIARRAGASEGTLFKRFQSKWGLFHAVMEQTNAVGMAWGKSFAARVGKTTLAAELEAVANQGIDFFRIVVPLHMVSGMSPQHMRMAQKSWGAQHPALEGRRRMEGYFEAERRLGRLKNVDVEVVARVFSGAIYNFAVMEILTGPYEESPLPQEKFVRHFVATLLGGIAADGAPRVEAARAAAPPKSTSQSTRKSTRKPTRKPAAVRRASPTKPKRS